MPILNLISEVEVAKEGSFEVKTTEHNYHKYISHFNLQTDIQIALNQKLLITIH